MKLFAGIIAGILAALTIVCIGLLLINNNSVSLPSPVGEKLNTTPDMSLTLGERFLNSQVIKAMPNDGTVRNVSLDVHPGNRAEVRATVDVNILGAIVTVNPTAAVTMRVENGRIVISVEKVNVGGVNVPSALVAPQVNKLKATAENELDSQLATIEANTGLRLSAMTSTEDSLIFQFLE